METLDKFESLIAEERKAWCEYTQAHQNVIIAREKWMAASNELTKHTLKQSIELHASTHERN